MKFLEKLGIDKETIEVINKLYIKEILEDIIYYEDNITENIKYFQSLKINNIGDLLIENISIFFQDNDNIVDIVKTIGEEVVVQKLNEDSSYLNEVF